MDKPPGQVKAAQILIYIFMVLGIIGFTVFLAEELELGVELVMFLFFSTLGTLSYGQARRSLQSFWKILAAVLWSFAIIAVGVFLSENDVHEGLVTAIIFSSLSLMLYLMFVRRTPTAAPAPPQLSQRSQVEWDQLGERHLYEEEPDPVKRDRPRR